MPVDAKSIDALRIDRGSTRDRRAAVVTVVLLLIVGAASAGGYFWWRSARGVVAVRTVAVIAAGGAGGTAGAGGRTLLNASGYVTARRLATVSSKVTGKVIEVDVEEGARVEEGQILAKLDASNVEASLRLAQAQAEAARRMLGETEANLIQAKRELERLEEAERYGAATAIEVQRADTLVRTLESRRERQEAEVIVADREVEVWAQQLEDTVIRAPFAGIVTAKNAQPGEMISPMSVGGFTRTGICTIVDMASLEIEVDVSESYINRVTPGQPVVATLDSYPEWCIPARVAAIIPTADRQKATVKVRVAFEALDPRILPDMSVKVAFQGDAEGGSGGRTITVPAGAVTQRNGRDVVWVVRNGVVERRAVTVAERRGAEVAIAAGLRKGERVLAEVPGDIEDGDRVKEVE